MPAIDKDKVKRGAELVAERGCLDLKNLFVCSVGELLGTAAILGWFVWLVWLSMHEKRQLTSLLVPIPCRHSTFTFASSTILRRVVKRVLVWA